MHPRALHPKVSVYGEKIYVSVYQTRDEPGAVFNIQLKSCSASVNDTVYRFCDVVLGHFADRYFEDRHLINRHLEEKSFAEILFIGRPNVESQFSDRRFSYRTFRPQTFRRQDNSPT